MSMEELNNLYEKFKKENKSLNQLNLEDSDAIASGSVTPQDNTPLKQLEPTTQSS